jgi:hypothetical protein
MHFFLRPSLGLVSINLDTNILFTEQMNGLDSTLPYVTNRNVDGINQQQRFYTLTEVYIAVISTSLNIHFIHTLI